MRISDILKKRKGVSPARKEKPLAPAREKKEGKPQQPAKAEPQEPIKSELEEKEVSQAGEQIYRECFLTMENFWMKLEAKKPYDLKPIQNLSIRLTKEFVRNPCLLAEVNKPHPPDNYLPYHSVNVCLISIAIGAKMKYGEEQLSSLALAALLHDVGMSRVPKEILLKKGNLPPEDWEKIKKHPIHNREILEGIEGITNEVLSGVSQYHERENGHGYPTGIKNGEIHMHAKVVGLADTYSALTHDRVYRKAVSPYHAIKDILMKDGQFFEPNLLKTLIEAVTFYPIGCFVELSSGEICLVKNTSSNYPTRPTIEVVLDEKKQKVQGRIIDLSKKPFVSIRKILKRENVEKYLNEK